MTIKKVCSSELNRLETHLTTYFVLCKIVSIAILLFVCMKTCPMVLAHRLRIGLLYLVVVYNDKYRTFVLCCQYDFRTFVLLMLCCIV